MPVGVITQAHCVLSGKKCCDALWSEGRIAVVIY